MKLNIVTAFKIKDKRIATLTEDYVKRIKPFGSLEIVEAPRGAGKKPEEFFRRFSGGIIGMDPAGKKMDSHQFADWLEKLYIEKSGVNFFIGEAEGLDKEVVSRADDLISLSDMTMAHRVALVVLAEQLYRAMTIIKGHPYHK